MKCNVGTADSMNRHLIGVGIIALGVYFESWLGVIGIVPILTGAMGWCPAYLPLGLDTCNEKSQ